mmetsp:Transcript_31943/g.95397  ORF Transcript_31943/g.95397 Transcript_31943/m.95397 type:complete len:249 (-) Transcript_31943:1441-2187(-)
MDACCANSACTRELSSDTWVRCVCASALLLANSSSRSTASDARADACSLISPRTSPSDASDCSKLACASAVSAAASARSLSTTASCRSRSSASCAASCACSLSNCRNAPPPSLRPSPPPASARLRSPSSRPMSSSSSVTTSTRSLMTGRFRTHMARLPNVRLCSVSSACSCVSATHTTSVVLALPPSDSCSSRVSLESRNGTWLPSAALALMHMPSVDKLLLMEIASDARTPTDLLFFSRSLPARSTK